LNPVNFFQICPFSVALVRCDSWKSRVMCTGTTRLHCDTIPTTWPEPCHRSRAAWHGVTQSCHSIRCDWPPWWVGPLPSSSLFFLFPPLSPCGGTIGDFRFLFANWSLWCYKLTLWVGIPIVLGTYVVFTVSFSYILKFSFGWTHVAGIRDEINVVMISMKWLCCMND
jgi:hypothetical protein